MKPPNRADRKMILIAFIMSLFFLFSLLISFNLAEKLAPFSALLEP